MTTLHFDQNSEAVLHLREVDAVLASLIDTVGPYCLDLRDDRFVALARAIVGQQLSVSAARTIWTRFVDAVGSLEPGAVAAVDAQVLRDAGLSRAKAAYVQDLAWRVEGGQVNLDQLEQLADEAVIAELTMVKGIGRWTAEMFLIFSLGRPDVYALDDVGLQRSMRLAYATAGGMTPQALVKLTEVWQPFRSVASLYLWEALDQGVLK